MLTEQQMVRVPAVDKAEKGNANNITIGLPPSAPSDAKKEGESKEGSAVKPAAPAEKKEEAPKEEAAAPKEEAAAPKEEAAAPKEAAAAPTE